MKCHGCGMSMVIDRCESIGHASTCWHRCPLCRKVRLVSQPDDPHDKRYATTGDTGSDTTTATARLNRRAHA